MTRPFPPGLKEKVLERFIQEFERTDQRDARYRLEPSFSYDLKANGSSFTVSIHLHPVLMWVHLLRRSVQPCELYARDRQTDVTFYSRDADVLKAYWACQAIEEQRRRAEKDAAPTRAVENLEKLIS